MRKGANYKESLRDGRNVWVLGEGPVADVTTHASTSAMVDEYVAWYDRHFDPEWQEILLSPSEGNGQQRPLAFARPRRLRISGDWGERSAPFISSPAEI